LIIIQSLNKSNMKVQLVAGTYRLDRKIGCGSFGVVYLATNTINGQRVAVKLELRSAKNPKLESEYKIYKMLSGGVGIAQVHWFGRFGDYNALVLDVLGPSLRELFIFCGRKFTLKTVLLLADQLLERIEYIHENNIIHRDIKPANFVMGLNMRQLNQVHVIDFGLSKPYRDPKSRKHVASVKRKHHTGTARYASINAHSGHEQSRRDDLESLGYMLIYLARGQLPWQGMKANSRKEFYDLILEKKMRTPVEVLCKDLPPEFATYLNYCRALLFDEKPEYSLLRKLFRKVFLRRRFSEDNLFDWTILNVKHSASLKKMIDSPSDRNSSSKASKTSHNTKGRYGDYFCTTQRHNDNIRILEIANYV